MLQRRTIAIILLIAFSLMPACASKTPKLRKQSEALRNLGEIYLNQNNFTAALKQFLEAEKIFADDYLLQDDLGRAYTARGRYQKALTHFKKSIQLQPDYAAAKNNLGSIYLMMKKWDKAIAVLDELSDDLLYGSPHYPLYNLGWAYYNKKMHKKARSYYKRSLELAPNFVLPMRGMGLSFMAQGRLSDAIIWFEKGAEKAPKFQEIHYELAGAYLKAHRYDDAKKSLQSAIVIAPDSATAQRAKRELEALSI